MARPKRLHLLTGRPSTFTVEKAVEILKRMHAGEPLTRIGKDPGMPPPITVQYWAENPRNAWFAAALREAQRQQARVWAESTLELSDQAVTAKSSPEIYGRQLQVNTRRWLAQRYDPETYGERVIQPAGGGATVSIYLPAKTEPGDSARVIEGQSKVVDQSDEPSDRYPVKRSTP